MERLFKLDLITNVKIPEAIIQFFRMKITISYTHKLLIIYLLLIKSARYTIQDMADFRSDSSIRAI